MSKCKACAEAAARIADLEHALALARKDAEIATLRQQVADLQRPSVVYPWWPSSPSPIWTYEVSAGLAALQPLTAYSTSIPGVLATAVDSAVTLRTGQE